MIWGFQFQKVHVSSLQPYLNLTKNVVFPTDFPLLLIVFLCLKSENFPRLQMTKFFEKELPKFHHFFEHCFGPVPTCDSLCWIWSQIITWRFIVNCVYYLWNVCANSSYNLELFTSLVVLESWDIACTLLFMSVNYLTRKKLNCTQK